MAEAAPSAKFEGVVQSLEKLIGKLLAGQAVLEQLRGLEAAAAPTAEKEAGPTEPGNGGKHPGTGRGASDGDLDADMPDAAGKPMPFEELDEAARTEWAKCEMGTPEGQKRAWELLQGMVAKRRRTARGGAAASG